MAFVSPSQGNRSAQYFALPTTQRHLASNPLTVFNTSIPLRELLKNRDVLLADDLEGNQKWGMHRVIQRNITHRRVKEIVDRYLEDKNKAIKFFPGITIALLPISPDGIENAYCSGDGFRAVDGFYVYNPTEQNELIENDLSGYIKELFPVRLQWDKDKLAALVIDGQHRVQALRNFQEENPGKVNLDERLPASVLFFDPQNNPAPLSATRQIFIDVNNTPQRVSEQRLIFIDDSNLIRRLTAAVVGSPFVSEETADPYVEMLSQANFSDHLLGDAINRYFIAEERSDDETPSHVSKGHDLLLPWEVTHIMTLHHVLIQNALLSYGESGFSPGLGPDLRRACQFVNSALTARIVQTQSSEELKEIREHLKENDDLRNDEKQLFRGLMAFQEDLIEEMSTGNGDSDGDPDEHSSNDEVRERYQHNCKELTSFEMNPESCKYLIRESAFGHAKTLVVTAFTNLWLYREIKEAAVSPAGGLTEEKLFFFLVHAKENRAERRSNNAVRDLCYEFAKGEEKPEEIRDDLIKWANNLEKTISHGAILRTQVGQQALFAWIIRNDWMRVGGSLLMSQGERGFEPETIRKYVEGLMEKINSAGITGLFTREQQHAFGPPRPDGEVRQFSALEGLVIEGKSMKPGWSNADRAALFLLMIEGDVESRAVAAQGNTAVTLRQYNNVIKSVGGAILKKFREHHDNEWIMDWATSHLPVDDYLTENEVIHMQGDPDDLSQAYITSLTKKALGGAYCAKIVHEYKECFETESQA